MWWIRWGIATLPDELGAPPAPPPPPPPPLLAGEGLSESGDGVPLTLVDSERSVSPSATKRIKQDVCLLEGLSRV